MGRNVISAKLDIIFKKIFSENEDILRDFLAKVLEIPGESIGHYNNNKPGAASRNLVR